MVLEDLLLKIRIRAPQSVDDLAVLDLESPRSRPQSRHGRPSFNPRPSWLVSKLLEKKAEVSGRKQ